MASDKSENDGPEKDKSEDDTSGLSGSEGNDRPEESGPEGGPEEVDAEIVDEGDSDGAARYTAASDDRPGDETGRETDSTASETTDEDEGPKAKKSSPGGVMSPGLILLAVLVLLAAFTGLSYLTNKDKTANGETGDGPPPVSAALDGNPDERTPPPSQEEAADRPASKTDNAADRMKDEAAKEQTTDRQAPTRMAQADDDAAPAKRDAEKSGEPEAEALPTEEELSEQRRAAAAERARARREGTPAPAAEDEDESSADRGDREGTEETDADQPGDGQSGDDQSAGDESDGDQSGDEQVGDSGNAQSSDDDANDRANASDRPGPSDSDSTSDNAPEDADQSADDQSSAGQDNENASEASASENDTESDSDPIAKAQLAQARAALSEQRRATARQSREIEALRRELDTAMKEQDRKSQQRIGELERRIERIQTQDVAAATRQAATALAVSNLQRQMYSGRPFGEELSVLAKLTSEDAAIRELRKYARDGLPSMSYLQYSYLEAARAALAAARREQAAGPFGRFWANFIGLFSVRKQGATSGDNPSAVISRAEASLEAGDLEAALRELSALDGEPKEAMAPWMEEARARVAADQLLDDVSNRVLAQAG